MARAATLGNGTMLVGLDTRGQVRDLYYPHIGLENHVSGEHVHRIGVWYAGEVCWLESPEWDVIVELDSHTNIARMSATHARWGITLESEDGVYNERNIFIRMLRVTNTAKDVKDVKVFFAQEFEISESHRGDTGYFDPRFNAIIHYKGKRTFLVGAENHGKSFTDYSVGIFEIEGKEGTHVDARDGVLSKNPIEHGRVDSVFGFELRLGAEKTDEIAYWIAVGESVAEVGELQEYINQKTPKYILSSSAHFWRAWVSRQQFNFHDLPERVVDEFNKSLFIIRAHTDREGAVIASSDSDMLQHGRDTYSYMWPRDGAFACMALIRAGDTYSSRKFFEFVTKVISEDGYLMHKYRPDGSLGSSWHPWVRGGMQELPIQEDETAIILVALWEYYVVTRDVEFIESLFNPLIKKAANFMLSYAYPESGLPYASYDLWEEKYGISTYTCSVKYGALFAAARFSKILGKRDLESTYMKGAEMVHKAILKHLYNDRRGMFYKHALEDKAGKLSFDETLDISSLYGVLRFGVLPMSDARMRTSLRTLEKELMLTDGTIGGMPRYEHDAYYRTGNEMPPNPWIITTLWRAKMYLRNAKKEKDLEVVKEILVWASKYALPSGAFPEQLDPHIGSPLSATPLTWSHSEFVTTVIEYLYKLEELGICKAKHPIE